MADKKISALTAATTPLAGTEVLPIVQSSTTVKVSVDNLTAGRTVGALKYEADYTATSPSLSGSTGTGLRLRASTGLFTVFGADPATAFAGWLQVSNGAGSAFPLAINPLGGKVGIGNNNPAELLDVSGNIKSTTGNFVVGTAGQGIDFSANGGDVLKQYDEGTWTPVVTASSGAITSYTSSGRFTRVGREVTAVLTFKLTNAGTASGAIIATLPFSSDAAITYIGCGRDDNLGSMLQGRVITAIPGSVYITTYANASIAVTNTEVFLTIQYFV